MTRKITDDEKALWKVATRGVRSKDSLDNFLIADEKIKVSSKVDLKSAIAPINPPVTPLITPQKGLHSPLISRIIDQKSLKKIANGRLNIDGRLDLHGMWLNQAHAQVIDFIINAHETGKRRLLIITGKGGLDGGGRIRAELPLWLEDNKINKLVSSFSPSSPRHGGSGAFYVVLRK